MCCNAVELLDYLIAKNITPDALTDQTSAHDPLNGYVPVGMSMEQAAALRASNPGEYTRKSLAAMERHVASYSDEWADTLADPERLARFVHFVNAPEVPDPSIRRVPERGQSRPVDLAGPTLQVVRA